jgi:glycosyltransferase involved in cell wall biosynthesis
MNMKKYVLLEVFSGLGSGGAERSFLGRFPYQPSQFKTYILNRKSKLDKLTFPYGLEVLVSPRGYVAFFKYTLRMIKSIEPNVVITRTPIDALSLCLMKRFFFDTQFKLVFEAHSVMVSPIRAFSLPIRLLLTALRGEIDLTIAVSKAVANGPQCRGHKKIQTHYLGSSVMVPPHLIPYESHPRVLMVGRLVKIKRPEMIILALHKLRDRITIPNHFLTIVGDGPLLSHLEKLVTKLDLQNMVVMSGYQSDIKPFLVTHTHLISCSTKEGLPLTFFEAKMSGLRIVATPAGGGREIFDTADTLLSDFSEQSLETELYQIIRGGLITCDERKQIASASQWMHTSSTGPSYYRIIETTLAH